MKYIVAFLNSNFFIGMVTLVVGLVAYYLYIKQRRDEKQEAATVILTELKNAVNSLSNIKPRYDKSAESRSAVVNEGELLIKAENWSKYKYMFVTDFTLEEWRELDSFYASCEEYNLAIEEAKSYFLQNIQQTWVAINAFYFKELEMIFSKDPKHTITDKGLIVDLNESFLRKIMSFTDTYIKNAGTVAAYNPMKPINDADRAMRKINEHLLVSPVGAKLEALALRRRTSSFSAWQLPR